MIARSGVTCACASRGHSRQQQGPRALSRCTHSSLALRAAPAGARAAHGGADKECPPEFAAPKRQRGRRQQRCTHTTNTLWWLFSLASITTVITWQARPTPCRRGAAHLQARSSSRAAAAAAAPAPASDSAPTEPCWLTATASGASSLSASHGSLPLPWPPCARAPRSLRAVCFKIIHVLYTYAVTQLCVGSRARWPTATVH